jgi:hypothetical protein
MNKISPYDSGVLRSITAGEQIDHLRPKLGYRAIKHLMVDEPDLEWKEQGRVYFGIWRIKREFLAN